MSENIENDEVDTLDEETTESVNDETTSEVSQQDDEEVTTKSRDDSDDEEGHDEETAEEAEARRQRNRERRKQNKESRKEYIESLKRELAARDAVINDLSTRVASVEQQGQGNQMAQIDNAIREAEQYYNHFKTVHQKAIEMADGAAATDATEKMFAIRQRFDMLQNAKRNMVQQGQAPRPLDARLKQHAETWMQKNAWYDPSGKDMDSDLVLRLDDRLVKEGWNPTTQEYWDELDARVKKYLPHRANSNYNRPKVEPKSEPSKKRVPVGGSGGDSGNQSKGQYRLSAERVQALKEAGIYDDPVKRAEAIKRYQEYDKQAGN